MGMEMTKCVGGMLESAAAATTETAEAEEEDKGMEMTKCVGGMLESAAAAATQTAEEEDIGMEITQCVGGTLKGAPADKAAARVFSQTPALDGGVTRITLTDTSLLLGGCDGTTHSPSPSVHPSKGSIAPQRSSEDEVDEDLTSFPPRPPTPMQNDDTREEVQAISLRCPLVRSGEAVLLLFGLGAGIRPFWAINIKP